MLKPFNIGNFVLGIDMLSGLNSLPKGAVRDAVDVDLDISGQARSRSGFQPALDLPGAHSIWGSADRTFGLLAQDDKLRRLIVRDGAPLTAVVLTGLTRSERMSYAEEGGQVFFTNGHELGVITRTEARLLGLPVPPAPVIVAGSAGVFPAGRYSLAVSYVATSGEESGLSAMADIDLSVPGSLMGYSQPVSGLGMRVYATSTNGDVLYRVAEVAAGASFVLGSFQPDKAADSQFLRPMPAGACVRYFNGRIMTAKGRVLTFSQPFRYGLTDPRTDFVQFSSDVVMVEAVAGGVYVALGSGQTYFLAGGGPADFKQQLVSTTPVVPWSSTLVTAGHLDKDLAPRAEAPAAMWLGQTGYVVGLPSGGVVAVQTKRIMLPTHPSGYTTTSVRQGIKQAVSIVESSSTAGQGLAVDPQI